MGGRRHPVTTILLAMLLIGGCGQEPSVQSERPSETAPTAEGTPTAGERAGGPAQTNDCPAHVQCHPAWRTCHCTLNARGDVVMMEADFDGDQRPDLRMTHVYDAEGNLLRWEHDRGADGTVETPCVFEPPCPPPHPNDECRCYGAPREVSREEVEERLREAGDRAEPVDPAEAGRILDAVEAR